MLWLIIFLLLVLTAITFRNKHLFSPWTITFLVWIVELFLFLVLDHGLYQPRGYFEGALLIWITTFCSTSFLTYLCFKPQSQQFTFYEYNHKVFMIMFLLAVIFVPISAYLTYKSAISSALSSNIFFDLRNNASSKVNDSSILNYITFIALIPLLAECNSRKINKTRLIILYTLNIVLALTTMAKTSLFVTLISSIYILVCNKKLKPSVFLYIFTFFICLTVIFNALRSYSGEFEDNMNGSIIYTYLLSPISAFDHIADKIIFTQDGSYTLRFFYQFAQSIGFNVEAQSTVQEFVEIPTPTNVYTIFFQYYADYGYIGILIFGIIDGIIYGYVYSKITQNPHLKLFYSYLVASLFLQFFNEIFFVTMSIVIQIFILSKIIYLKQDINICQR